MFILNAESRSQKLKAKQLRRSGIVPISLYGSDIENSLLLQASEIEARKMLKSSTKDSSVILQINGKKTIALLREINHSPMGNQIDNLNFQKLVEDEKITSTAQIVLLNKEKVPQYIQQSLFEVSYKTYPSNLVEKIDIDLDGMKAGDTVRVADLDIAKNEDIELVTDPENVILSLVEAKLGEADESESTESQEA